MGPLFFAPVALCLHVLFVGITLVGGVLFLAWALKLKPDQLKIWVLWLLIVGILGALLTSSFSVMGSYKFHGKFMNYGEKQNMMLDGTIAPGSMMQGR